MEVKHDVPVRAEDHSIRMLNAAHPRRTPYHDQERWDHLLQELGGQLHQSWRWGEFRERDGWGVERVVTDGGDDVGMAQILFKRRGPVSTAFIPRGPLVRGDQGQVLPELFAAIDHACRRHRALSITIEPEQPLVLDGMARAEAFPTGEHRYTPGRTVMVPLVDDEALVRQMHATKRWEIRRATRRGITIDHCAVTESSIASFHSVLEDTSTRNRFRINPPSYYARFLEKFGEDAALMFAMVDGNVAAGLIAARFGPVATYLFGASSSRYREPGASAYLHYQAMRWAREQGCTRYDLWGIPDTDPDSFVGPDQTPVRSLGRDDSGLYRFKVAFGGEIVTYPPCFEYRYRPAMSWMVRRLKAIDRAIRQ